MAELRRLRMCGVRGPKSDVWAAQVLSIGAIVASHASQMSSRGVAAKNFMDVENSSSFANHS